MSELKKKVAELGLPTKGTKVELLARVEKYLHEQGECCLSWCGCVYMCLWVMLLAAEEEELLEEQEEVEEDGEGVEEDGEGVEEIGDEEGGQDTNLDESKGDSILEQAGTEGTEAAK